MKRIFMLLFFWLLIIYSIFDLKQNDNINLIRNVVFIAIVYIYFNRFINISVGQNISSIIPSISIHLIILILSIVIYVTKQSKLDETTSDTKDGTLNVLTVEKGQSYLDLTKFFTILPWAAYFLIAGYNVLINNGDSISSIASMVLTTIIIAVIAGLGTTSASRNTYNILAIPILLSLFIIIMNVILLNTNSGSTTNQLNKFFKETITKLSDSINLFRDIDNQLLGFWFFTTMIFYYTGIIKIGFKDAAFWLILTSIGLSSYKFREQIGTQNKFLLSLIVFILFYFSYSFDLKDSFNFVFNKSLYKEFFEYEPNSEVSSSMLDNAMVYILKPIIFVFFFFISICLIIIYSIKLLINPSFLDRGLKFFIKILSIVLIGVILLYKIFVTYYDITKYGFFLLSLIIVGLAFFVLFGFANNFLDVNKNAIKNFNKHKVNNPNSIGNLFKYIALYAICLLRDFYTYLKEQTKNVPRLHWAILFLALILLMFIILVPILYKTLIMDNSIYITDSEDNMCLSLKDFNGDIVLSNEVVRNVIIEKNILMDGTAKIVETDQSDINMTKVVIYTNEISDFDFITDYISSLNDIQSKIIEYNEKEYENDSDKIKFKHIDNEKQLQFLYKLIYYCDLNGDSQLANEISECVTEINAKEDNDEIMSDYYISADDSTTASYDTEVLEYNINLLKAISEKAKKLNKNDDGYYRLTIDINIVKSLVNCIYKDVYESTDFKQQYVDYNFGLSFWLYLDTEKLYNEPVEIINFNNHPRIMFNGYKDELVVYYNSDDDDNFITIPNIKLQKYDNWLFNYSYGTLDIFLNTKLIHSIKNIKLETNLDKEYITLGSSTNKINGKICHLSYYKKSLSKLDIILQYYARKIGNY